MVVSHWAWLRQAEKNDQKYQEQKKIFFSWNMIIISLGYEVYVHNLKKKYYMDRDLYFFFIFFNMLWTLSCLIKIVTHFINFQLSKRKQKEKHKSDSVHSWKNPETHPNLFSKISSFLKERNTSNLEIYIIECPLFFCICISLLVKSIE